MNMKRIVFATAAILICLIIIGISLHTMNKISDMNHERREQEKGEAIASRLAASTTVTTSIWDKIRTTETQTVSATESTTFEENTEQTEQIETITAGS